MPSDIVAEVLIFEEATSCHELSEVSVLFDCYRYKIMYLCMAGGCLVVMSSGFLVKVSNFTRTRAVATVKTTYRSMIYEAREADQ